MSYPKQMWKERQISKMKNLRNKHIILLAIVALLSIFGNVYQYTFHKGYDANVSMVIDAYVVEQNENFDLNTALHHRNLILFDLQYKLEECLAGQVAVIQ